MIREDSKDDWDGQTVADRVGSRRGVIGLAAAGAMLLWLAQPPVGAWPLAWVALVPWLMLVSAGPLRRSDYLWFYLASAAHWLLTLQGIRHAHPAMFLGWIALSLYLAVYPLIWLAVLRGQRRWPLWLAAPVVWAGLEWCRNHFLTGISAAMLGHSQVSVPTVLQIADAFGSYGVSFVIVLVNVAVAAILLAPSFLRSEEKVVRCQLSVDSLKTKNQERSTQNSEATPSPRWGSTLPPSREGGMRKTSQNTGPKTGRPPSREGGRRQARMAVTIAAITLLVTLGYGRWRLDQAAAITGETTTTIALLGRDEPIEFEQSLQREQEIFGAYFEQARQAAEQAGRDGRSLSAVVWPESMFTGSVPWIVADRQQPLAQFPGESLPEETLWEMIEDRQRFFVMRARQVQAALQRASGQATPPVLLGGCSIVRYDGSPAVHSGCVEFTADGEVGTWYGKMHLVMFGEYIPLVDYLPFLKRIMPPGLVVKSGTGPVAIQLDGVIIAPNVCIETAVERVTINHVRTLMERGQAPDYVVNVTNDGWFDGSSIVEHHLRSAQLVAVGCRRPVLIAANGGPTAWIDGSGRIVQRLANHEAGTIIVSGGLDGRRSGQLVWGDWPARLAAVATLLLAVGAWRGRRGEGSVPVGLATEDTEKHGRRG